MKSSIDQSDEQVLNLIDEFFGQIIFYFRSIDIDHVHIWKNDSLNINHTYVRMVRDILQKIRDEIPRLSPGFKSKFPEFMDSLRRIAEARSLVWLEKADLRFFIDQEIPDMVLHLKAVSPDTHIAQNQFDK